MDKKPKHIYMPILHIWGIGKLLFHNNYQQVLQLVLQPLTLEHLSFYCQKKLP